MLSAKAQWEAHLDKEMILQAKLKGKKTSIHPQGMFLTVTESITSPEIRETSKEFSHIGEVFKSRSKRIFSALTTFRLTSKNLSFWQLFFFLTLSREIIKLESS
jgi:hypothetical protein